MWDLEVWMSLGIIVLVLIIMIIMIARSPSRTQLYKKHIGKLTRTIQNPNTPEGTRKQAVKDLLRASPDNFDEENKK